MVKNFSCVSCAAWNVFPINSLLRWTPPPLTKWWSLWFSWGCWCPTFKKNPAFNALRWGNKVSVVRSLTQFTIVFYEFQFKVGVTLFFLPTDLMVRKLKSWTTRHLTWNIIGNMDILCMAWNMFKKIARNLNALKFYYHAFNPFKKIDHNFL